MTSGPRAVIVRDKDGYWFVGFPEVPGCHTQGRTLRAARTRMRDALSLFVHDADTAHIVEHLRLEDAMAGVRRTAQLREHAAEAQQEAQAAARAAVRSLLDAGLTLRDTR
jgi:predicted RNase H-like HicB family nuclease